MAISKEEKWVIVGYGAIAVAYVILVIAKFKHFKKS
jgi:hypothetical protein